MSIADEEGAGRFGRRPSPAFRAIYWIETVVRSMNQLFGWT